MSAATRLGPFLPNDSIGIPNYVAKYSAYADAATAEASVFLNQLASYLSHYTISNYNIKMPDNLTSFPSIQMPTAPGQPSVSINVPTLPPGFVPKNIEGLTVEKLGQLPVLTAVEPSLHYPNAPTPFSGTPPNTNVNIQTDFVFPDQPILNFPSLPRLQDIIVPTLASINLPDFTLALPKSDNLPLPGLTFSWSEGTYSDTLLSAIQSKLYDRIVTGGSMLNPTVENALWDRGRAREEQTALRTEYKTLVEFAQTNFTRPQGSQLAALEFAVQEAQNKIIDLSRDIMIKQAELEQDNIKSSLQYAITLEQVVTGLWNEQQKRKFEAAKYTQQVGIEIYDAAVKKLNVDIEIYKAYNITFESLLKKEMEKVDIYKQEIEAQRLVSQINEQSIKIYATQIESTKVLVDVYKTNIEAVQARIQAETLKLQNLKTAVEVYATQVQAKRDEYSMYAETIKAEAVKEEVYKTQVDAYASRVEAYAKNADALAKVSQVNIAVEEIRLKDYLAQLDTILKMVQTQQLTFEAAVDLYKGQTQLYAAQVSSETARVDLQLKEIEQSIQYQKAIADVSIENAKINIQNAIQSAQLNLEAMKSGAQVSAQVAAGALSAVNLSAGMQIQEQTSSSYAEQNVVTE